MVRRNTRPGASRCCWPQTSASVLGRIRCASGSFIGRSLLYCPAVLHGPYIKIVYLIFTRTARAIMKIILRWMPQTPFTKKSKHAIIIVHLRETRGSDEESCCGRRSLCQKGAGAPGHRPAENRISGCSLHAGLRPRLAAAGQCPAGGSVHRCPGEHCGTGLVCKIPQCSSVGCGRAR